MPAPSRVFAVSASAGIATTGRILRSTATIRASRDGPHLHDPSLRKLPVKGRYLQAATQVIRGFVTKRSVLSHRATWEITACVQKTDESQLVRINHKFTQAGAIGPSNDASGRM